MRSKKTSDNSIRCFLHYAPQGIFLLVQKDTKDTQKERGENRFDPKNICDVFRLCKTPLSPLDTSHPTKSAAPEDCASIAIAAADQ